MIFSICISLLWSSCAKLFFDKCLWRFNIYGLSAFNVVEHFEDIICNILAVLDLLVDPNLLQSYFSLAHLTVVSHELTAMQKVVCALTLLVKIFL